jgi:hypothetical protein
MSTIGKIYHNRADINLFPHTVWGKDGFVVLICADAPNSVTGHTHSPDWVWADPSAPTIWNDYCTPGTQSLPLNWYTQDDPGSVSANNLTADSWYTVRVVHYGDGEGHGYSSSDSYEDMWYIHTATDATTEGTWQDPDGNTGPETPTTITDPETGTTVSPPTETLSPGKTIPNAPNRVVFAQEGSRTFFVQTQSSKKAFPYFFDERDRKVYTLETPATPTISAPTVARVTTSVIDSLESTTKQAVTARTANPFYEAKSGLDSLNFDNDSVSGYWIRANTNTPSSSADGFWRNIASTDTGAVLEGSDYYLDWSAVECLYVDIYSGGSENAKGSGIVSFFFSETKSDGSAVPTDSTVVSIPLDITDSAKVVQVKIPIVTYSSASQRNKVKCWGFKFSSTQCVLSFHNLRTQTGLTGTVNVKAVDYKVLGSIVNDDGTTGFHIPSVETPAKEIECGDVGSTATFTLSGQTNTSVTLAKIYAQINGVTDQYHYVCDVTRTHAGVADSVTIPPSGTTLDDIVGNPTLQEGRCPIPQGANCVGLHHRRLALAKGGDLYLSAIGDYAYFTRMTPQDAVDAGYILTDADPIRLPLSQYGPIYGIIPLGLTTGSAFERGTLLSTGGGWDLVLMGDTPDTTSANRLRIADSRPGGLCTYYAWCYNNDRKVVKVDVNGDVREFGAALDIENALTNSIRDVVRNLPNASEWWFGYDGYTDRYILGCECTANEALGSCTIDANGTVNTLTLTYGGGPYASTPIVTFTISDEIIPTTQAAATATVVNGIVTALTVTDGGLGYGNAPVVTIGGDTDYKQRRVFAYDNLAGGWDEISGTTLSKAFCCAATGLNDDSYLMTGHDAGAVKRVYNPDSGATTGTASYLTKDFDANVTELKATRLMLHFTGTVAFAIISKNQGVTTIGTTTPVTSGKYVELAPTAAGETLAVRLDLSAGAKVKDGRLDAVIRRK